MSLSTVDDGDDIARAFFSLRFLLSNQTIATTEPQRTASEPTTPPTMAPRLLLLLLLLSELPFGSAGPEADGDVLVNEEEDAIAAAVCEARLEVDAGASVVEVVVGK